MPGPPTIRTRLLSLCPCGPKVTAPRRHIWQGALAENWRRACRRWCRSECLAHFATSVCVKGRMVHGALRQRFGPKQVAAAHGGNLVDLVPALVYVGCPDCERCLTGIATASAVFPVWGSMKPQAIPHIASLRDPVAGFWGWGQGHLPNVLASVQSRFVCAAEVIDHVQVQPAIRFLTEYGNGLHPSSLCWPVSAPGGRHCLRR